MAVWTTKTVGDLAPAQVLAPERYDPRRVSLVTGAAGTVSTYVEAARTTVGAGGRGATCPRYVVIDTSDAGDGVLAGGKPPVGAATLRAAKRLVRAGDVLVSRLRPYLRQIAVVDPAAAALGDGVGLVCSTEFFVLRATDRGGIAFLVPFLLSTPVQAVLAAAQEGGHHPRVSLATILDLPVPDALHGTRAETGRRVLASIAQRRRSEAALAALVETAGRATGRGMPRGSDGGTGKEGG